MEIPRLRLLAQSLHVIESGDINPNDVKKNGWAHTLSELRRKRIGRNFEQIIDDHNEYRKRKFQEESKENIQEQGILVVGLLSSVDSE